MAISGGHQSTFFLSHSCVSLHKGPGRRGACFWTVGSVLRTRSPCGPEALWVATPFICSQPIPLHSLLGGRVFVTVFFVDNSGVNGYGSPNGLANERLNIPMDNGQSVSDYRTLTHKPCSQQTKMVRTWSVTTSIPPF